MKQMPKRGQPPEVNETKNATLLLPRKSLMTPFTCSPPPPPPKKKKPQRKNEMKTVNRDCPFHTLYIVKNSASYLINSKYSDSCVGGKLDGPLFDKICIKDSCFGCILHCSTTALKPTLRTWLLIICYPN